MKTLAFLLCLGALTTAAAAEPAPVRNVNPDATPEARALLDFLYEIEGTHTLSGQHNFIATGNMFTDKLRDATGKTPIVWGSDFSFAYAGDAPERFQHCGPLNLTTPGTEVGFTGLTPEKARDQMVLNAIQAWKSGHIVTLMWHACPPGEGDTCDGRKIWAMEDRPSQEWWDQLTTDGTEVNEAWKEQADRIAGYLKQLQDANVPVLWRPYHEMNGVWFWWCNKKGDDGFRKLWNMMYDRYVSHHGLNNLVWVWNTNAPRLIPGDEAFAYDLFWPGSDTVDVLAADVYRGDWQQPHHDDLRALAAGKPIAIGEMAPPPTPRILDAQPYWEWFMPWGNLVFWGRGPEQMKTLMEDERVLNLEDVTRGEDGRYRITR